MNTIAPFNECEASVKTSRQLLPPPTPLILDSVPQPVQFMY